LIGLSLAGCALQADDPADVGQSAEAIQDCSNNVIPGDQTAIANARVFNIYWGKYWTDPSTGKPLADFLDQAAMTLWDDPMFYTPLIQYGAGFGSFAGSYTQDSNPAADIWGLVADSDIPALIDSLITDGKIPSGDPNLIYVVYLPQGDVDNCITSTGGRHAYTSNYPWAVINGNASKNSDLTVTTSHEIAEAITDPYYSSWGNHTNEREIGDLCNGQPTTLDGYTTQLLWSNENCGCVAPTKRAVIGGSVVAFQPYDQQHAYVLDSGNDLSLVATTGQRTPLASSVRQFQMVDGFLWWTDTSWKLWYGQPWTGLAPTLVATNVWRFKAAGMTAFFMRAWDMNLYRVPFGGSVTTVDGNVLDFAPIDATDVYVLGTDRNLWLEYPGTNKARLLIDGNVQTFAPSSGLVYVMGTDRKLWLETPGQGHGPNPVDANVGSFAPVDSSFVFVDGSDGRIWREHGDYTHRDFVDADPQSFQPYGRTTLFVLGNDGYLWAEWPSALLP
jgi:hypothetical protein